MSEDKQSKGSAKAVKAVGGLMMVFGPVIGLFVGGPGGNESLSTGLFSLFFVGLVIFVVGRFME